MYTGLAWYLALAAARDDRPEGQHCCSDLDYYRRLGVDVDARPRRRRIAKLRAAIPASLSVFRELMRRPAGATIVILAPRAERPTAADDTVVFDERELRDAS